MRRRKVQLLLAAVLGVMVALAVRCLLREEIVTDEQFLQDLVEKVAAAAEKRQIKEVRKWIARHYRDDRGRRYEQINQLLTLHLIARGVISVYIVDMNVVVNRDAVPVSASVDAVVILTRGPRVKRLSDILPRAARALDFELTLEKPDQDLQSWRLTAATWTAIRNVQDLLR